MFQDNLLEDKEITHHVQLFSGTTSTGWQIGNILPDGSLRASIFQDGNVFEIHPSSTSNRELTSTISYTLTTNDHPVNCLSLIPPEEGRKLEEAAHHQVSNRELLDEFVYFPGCYEGDSKAHAIHIGLVFDIEFQALFQSTEEMISYAAESIATMNSIYLRQFNVLFEVDHWELLTESNCMDSINDHLTVFTDETDLKRPKAASWHLLTGCPFPNSSYVGVSWVGTAFSTGKYITGITQQTRRGNFWRTISHELGHVVNAKHSFENGPYKTGGVMDYGNGYIKNTNQPGFNAERSSEMCSRLSYAVTSASPYFTEATPTKAPSRAPTSSPSTQSPTTVEPSASPSAPSKAPSTGSPSYKPTTAYPTAKPSTTRPSKAPTAFPTGRPTTLRPSKSPVTARPSRGPTAFPTARPATLRPSKSPVTARPSRGPTAFPTARPTTLRPSKSPVTARPSRGPTSFPTARPTTSRPSKSPPN